MSDYLLSSIDRLLGIIVNQENETYFGATFDGLAREYPGWRNLRASAHSMDDRDVFRNAFRGSTSACLRFNASSDKYIVAVFDEKIDRRFGNKDTWYFFECLSDSAQTHSFFNACAELDPTEVLLNEKPHYYVLTITDTEYRIKLNKDARFT